MDRITTERGLRPLRLAALVAGLVLAGCGSAAPAALPAIPPPGGSSVAAAGPAPTISDAWAAARSGATDEDVAVYAIVTGGAQRGDRIVGATVLDAAAKRAELHATVRENGAMKMVTVEGFDIPVSGTLTLEPGAAHIMLVGVARPLKAGDTLTISLRLQSGATIETKVEVRQGTERAPASSSAPATQEPAATPEATRTASYTDSCG